MSAPATSILKVGSRLGQESGGSDSPLSPMVGGPGNAIAPLSLGQSLAFLFLHPVPLSNLSPTPGPQSSPPSN